MLMRHHIPASFGSSGFRILLAACLLFVGLSSPCFAASDDTMEPSRIQTYASEILQGIMSGITEGDYNKYSTDFSDTLRKAVNHESFLQVQKNLRTKVGKFRSVEYIGFYVQENQAIALFKARFGKTKDDVLITLVLDPHKSAAPKVTGIWFDAPSLRE